MKETTGTQLDARLVKNELEAFLLYVNENMITKIVERTNDQTLKVYKKINTDKFLFGYRDTNKEEIKCLFGLLYFRGLYHDTKQPRKEFSYDTLSAKKMNRATTAAQNMKFFIKDFFSKCDQIRRKLRIWSH